LIPMQPGVCFMHLSRKAKKMKSSFLFIALLLSITSYAQKIDKELGPFTKVLIGPGINIELIQSDEEHIHMVSDTELLHDISINVDNDELKVYFPYKDFSFRDEDGEIAHGKYSLENTPYEGIRVYGKLYFNDLKSVDFRGEEKLLCNGNIRSEDLTLKIYGDTQVKLNDFDVEKLTLKCYGENENEILHGNVWDFKITSYGERRVMTKGMRCENIKLTSFGESDIDVYAENSLKVRVLGEGNIRYKGDPQLKEFSLGEADIQKID